MIAVAVVTEALAVLLWVAPRPRLRPAPAGPGPGGHRVRVLALLVAAGLTAALVPRFGLLAVVLGGAALGVAALWRRHQRRRTAAQVADLVLETCEVLAGELAAGRPPSDALDRAATSWPALGPVAEAFRIGSDVPAALRDLGDHLDGARDLRVVAAAWQVSHRTGEGLAVAVDRVADALRDAAATRRLVAGELASARATARLVGCLPVLALLMGSGAGGDPWGFLLGEPLGLACLAGGLTFGLAGLAWIEAIARDVEESG